MPTDRANLLSATHRGNHVANYNEALGDFLDAIDAMRPGLSNDAARDAIIDGIENMRNHLANADVQLNGRDNLDLTTAEIYNQVYEIPLELARGRRDAT